MHTVLIVVLLACLAGIWQCYKWYQREKKIGEVQEVTQNLKTEEEVNKINKYNDELASKIKGEPHE